MKTIEGLAGTKATVICDSISEAGIRLITYELEYARLVHSEFLTHSMLARNSASSRAIPFAKMQGQLTGIPVRFGANQAGMQDSGELVEEVAWYNERAGCEVKGSPEAAWEYAKQLAVDMSTAFHMANAHKQIFNRLTETFSMMKTVVTGTEWANFFWLRNDTAADPTLHELARCMWEAKEASKPSLLKDGEWHLPYVEFYRDDSYGALYAIQDDFNKITCLSVEDAIKVSAACCAAVSFRNEDYTLEKSLQVYDKLVGAERKHASAFGHQASPMRNCVEDYIYGEIDVKDSINVPHCSATWEPGVSHTDRDGQLWSAMLQGWVQHRKLIPGENYIDKGEQKCL